MANTKVTKAVLADDAVGIFQLDITNDPSDGQALTASNDGANNYTLAWANNTVAGISSSADATAITIDSSERVGIGTTSGGSALHVDKSVAAPAVTIHNTGGASSAYAGLEVETSTTGSYIQRWVNSGTEVARMTYQGLAIGGTGAANTLDDYEEGTWTPTLAGYSFGNISATYTSQSGTYRKFGNLVYITVGIAISAISSQPSGTDYPVVNGMPFSQTGSSYVDNGNVTRNSALRSSPVITKAMGGGSSIFLGVDQSTAFPPWANSQPWTTGELSFSMWYYTS